MGERERERERERMFLNSNMNSNFYESHLDKYKETDVQVSERLLIRRRFEESGTFRSSFFFRRDAQTNKQKHITYSQIVKKGFERD